MPLYDADSGDQSDTATPEQVAALELPPGTHAAILTATDPFRSPLTCAVVWSDRASDECPGCERALPRVEPDCPVVLHSNGAVDRSQWHECDHCGADIMVPWQEVRPSVPGADATTDDIRAAAGELAAELDAAIAARRERIHDRLTDDLRRALDHLAAPLDDDETYADRQAEVRTGSEGDPGVCHNGEEWVAWAPGVADAGVPDGEPVETIVVTASDLGLDGTADARGNA